MLINIGIRGGSSVFSLGTDSDMRLFFDCIEHYVVAKYPKQNWPVLTDRLYRRYLKLEELDTAEMLMKLVEGEFKQLDMDVIDTDCVVSGKIKTDLDITQNSLHGLFEKYFDAFYYCVESAKINYEGFKSNPDYRYQPVMVAITSLPYSISYKQIPLSVFDELKADDKPIWWTGKIPKNL